MRMLAKLLIQSGDSGRACEFAHQAYASKHQAPADVLAYALALEASGNLSRAREVGARSSAAFELTLCRAPLRRQ